MGHGVLQSLQKSLASILQVSYMSLTSLIQTLVMGVGRGLWVMGLLSWVLGHGSWVICRYIGKLR